MFSSKKIIRNIRTRLSKCTGIAFVSVGFIDNYFCHILKKTCIFGGCFVNDLEVSVILRLIYYWVALMVT